MSFVDNKVQKLSTMNRTLCIFWMAYLLCLPFSWATKLVQVKVLDQNYLMVHFIDGEVTFVDDGVGPGAYTNIYHDINNNNVVRYGTALNTSNASNTANWRIKSSDDPNYGTTGLVPLNCYRKSKLNGMFEGNWNSSIADYDYDHTLEHSIFLRLPQSLVQGKTYTLEINSNTNTDVTSSTLVFNIFTNQSEAIHVNLVGYSAAPSIKAADLYYWLGDGGARDYSSFVGKKVYLYNVNTQTSQEVSSVVFGVNNGTDVGGYYLVNSNTWKADFSGFNTPGTYRLAIEGVGCSQDFVINNGVYFDPFMVGVKGYFYMRIGQAAHPSGTPVPRQPLFIPNSNPSNTKVYLTTMHPYHPNWSSFASGDPWDQPNNWAPYVKAGNPENNNAYGGHSDALDWDRHLGHVSIIYDMLLPYILTNGALPNDNLGIAESGNGIPDVIDEARNEVDFWLRLRDGQGYAHGLTNPNGSNILYQAGPTAMAAWANAANCAMLAEAFRIAGNTTLMNQYRDEAITAYNFASGLPDQMLDNLQDIGESRIRGRDLKMTAAAYLYNVTGNTIYEDAMKNESVVTGPSTDVFSSASYNQTWATAGYLKTNRTVNYPTLFNNMKAAIIATAKTAEANNSNTRPSRRSTDNSSGYFHTIQNVQRSLIAHSVATVQADKDLLENAMILEADWGLGRNPANCIQMTTASTTLANKRSIISMYTSGWDDGSAGLQPGHTPYMNLDDWSPSMVMGRPSWMYSKGYPSTTTNWPRAELYFNTRYVWSHAEFTPQQTMRGKLALYAYLYAIGNQAPPPPTVPLVPSNLSATTASSSQINLSWTDNATDETTYKVERASAVAGPWTEIVNNLAANTTSYSATGLSASTTYYFRVRAANAVGNSSYSNTANATTNSIPPAAPTNLTATAVSTSQINLSWTDNANNETAYKVERAGAAAGPWTEIASNLSANTTTYSATGLSAATTYYFRVRAANTAGNSAYANTANATTNAVTTTSTLIYGDALESDWSDWSWGSTRNFSNTSPVQNGIRSIRVTYSDPYGGLSLRKGTGISASNLSEIRFWVRASAVRNLTFYSQSTDSGGNSTTIAFTTNANAWKEIIITKAQLGNPATIKRINFQANNFTGDVYFDQIRYITTNNFSSNQAELSLIEPTEEAWSSPKASFDIFPNPSSSKVNLDFNLTQDRTVDIWVMDLTGKRVQQYRVNAVQGQNRKEIDVSKLAKGIYSVQLLDGMQQHSAKMIVH